MELARGGAVSRAAHPSAEFTLRVATRGGLVAPSVILDPERLVWDCDCRALEDPCEHVAASVIALRRNTLAEGPAQGRGTLGYRLRRAGDAIGFERVVVGPDGESAVGSTLAALASGAVDGPAFVASEADLEVERALGSTRSGVLAPATVRRLLGPLSSCPDVTLDGRAVKTDPEPVLPIATVEDCALGFRVTLRPDPRIRERVAEGLVLWEDRLRPLGATGLTGRELEDYTRGLVVPVEDAARLVTEILPQLRERVVVEVRTERLPATRVEPPRLVLDVERDEDSLSVLPTLVYGDPPCARVDAGRLVHLRGAVPLRDEALEARLLRHLRDALEMLPGHRIRVVGEEALELAERLRSFGGEIRGDAHLGFFRTAPLEPRLHLEGDRFGLDFEVPADPARGRAATRISAPAVLRAWTGGESLLALAGGGFAPVPVSWLERWGDRVASLLEARRADGEVARWLLPDLAALSQDQGLSRPPGFERLRRLVDEFEELPRACLPSDLRAELRAYQRRGVDWLAFHRDAGLGALLADDMGLGKTLQALCAIRGRALVVCPTSVLIAWRDEMDRFRPELSVSLYHGPDRQLDAHAEVTVTTYALLRADEAILTGCEWDCVVLDESQAIKNPDSQVARAAHRLRAGFRVALTGTPVENRLEELWSQMQFLNPGLLGSRREFQDRIARRVAAGDATAIARLRERIRPFVLRRLKSQVASELPPRTEVVLRCELEEEERSVYEAVRAATRRDVVRRLASGGSVLAALEALLRLRQACCHPALVPGQTATTSSKLELLLEELDCAIAEGHRALVFSQWTALLDLVEPHLRDAGFDFVRLDGSTRDRGAVVAEFQREGGPPVMLISLRAGGTGLSLTAADHVFLLDPWWNPAVEDQAADRAHRIGQPRPVLIHRLVARHTVEEGILALQQRKRDLGSAALGGVDGWGSLSRDDLLALLE